MNNKRRNLLKGGLALGGAAVFGAGYAPKVAEIANGVMDGTSGVKTADPIHGNSLSPEYQVKDGKLLTNPHQVVCNTQCMSCWTQCGIRARVDLNTNQVIRISGNPYHPLSSDKTLPFGMPIAKAELLLAGESGIENRSTACARGAAFLEGVNSPYRITQPLKRVGKRGEGKWQTISFEQLVEEIVNSGDLFGEGEVEGLKAIRNLVDPINPKQPDLGMKANQLLVTFAGPEGRQPILQSFAQKSFGTINFSQHGAYCGASYRNGSGAFMKDFDNNPHAKPDWDHAEFILFIGTSPAQSGNPFKRQARQLAKRRPDDNFSYVVVSPRLEMTSSLATQNNHWVPIKSEGDLALVMGMLRWIIENERFNADYLSRPNLAAMENASHVSYANASHLIICEPNHPKFGQALRISDLQDVQLDPEEKVEENLIVVKDQATGELISAKNCLQAVIFVEQIAKLLDGSEVLVKSSMQLLKEATQEKTLAEYSDICGVPVQTIENLAKKFTSHGHKANPTVDMTVSIDEVLKGVDAVIVTHTHHDHWDDVAQQRVPKDLPIFVQNAGDASLIRSQGFTDVRVVGKDTPFEGVTLTRTRGQHGTDAMYANPKIAEMVGDAMGVVMKAEGKPTVYLVGDTIWNHEIEHSFNTYKPDFVVLNAGCAKLPNFEGSPIMCTEDVSKAHKIAPQAKILTVHMDALPQTSISSDQMRDYVQKEGLNRVTVPKNGDVIKF